MLRSLKPHPLLFVKLNYLICINLYTLTIKRINNKEPSVVTLLERIYQICVCQGEHDQPIHFMIVICCLVIN
jgi:hypothetical protein